MRDQVIALVKDLLLQEYLQRDVYETYAYYLFGLSSPAIQEHLAEHMAEENKHIETLQRYLMDLGSPPIVDRLEIPFISANPTLEEVLRTDLELEKGAVENYSRAVDFLDDYNEYTALRVDIENILVQEQEHVHDIVQWLTNINGKKRQNPFLW